MKLITTVFRQTLLIILLYQCNHTKTSGHQKCEGGSGQCCDGYIFNETLGNCTECENGYFGTNCSSQCPYNSYGKACQMFCNCPEASCNFAEGCPEDDPGWSLLSDGFAHKHIPEVNDVNPNVFADSIL
ncbi:uncharacterized protein LOC144625649 [Crassostrea virginica]